MSSLQRQFIKDYNKNNREEFNPLLFYRSEDDIIEELKKVIMSCQREDKTFTLKVLGFEVIDNYEEMMRILIEFEGDPKKNKRKIKENQYEYVNLKGSDIKLLIIKYYLKGKDNKGKLIEETIDVLLAVPRIVDKYYFKISGNYYSAMFQIVDGSTYNNATSSNAKRPCVTLRSFLSVRIYRYATELISRGEPVVSAIYYSIIFNKSIIVLKYIFAKYGLMRGLSFLGIGCITITNTESKYEDFYSFKPEESNIYINVPKYIFDNNEMVQSVVATLYRCITKNTKYNDFFTNNYWLESLGADFKFGTIEKGLSALSSLEFIYDIKTKESIKLPDEYKETVYDVLKWMTKEFGNLKNKDNLNLGYKRLRFAEYLASIYSMKLCNGIYWLAGMNQKNVTIGSLRKIILISPMYLLNNIVKCQLVNYRDLVNDLDAVTALKYSYKEITSGDKGNNIVPEIMKYIDLSDLGRLDPDSSHKSDPGRSGIICPLVQLDGMSFSNYQEPNFWDGEFDKLMTEYRQLTNRKEILQSKKKLLGYKDNDNEEESLTMSINTVKRLFNPLMEIIDDGTSTPIENVGLSLPGGLIYYEF